MERDRETNSPADERRSQFGDLRGRVFLRRGRDEAPDPPHAPDGERDSGQKEENPGPIEQRRTGGGR
jgi:hypothetical protein